MEPNSHSQAFLPQDFPSLFEKAQGQLQNIKLQNDTMQQNCNNTQEYDRQFQQTLESQRSLMKEDIRYLKRLLQQCQKQTRINKQQAALKSLKEISNKEIDRFEIIMKNFIFTSFASMQKSQLGATIDDTSAFNSTIERNPKSNKNYDNIQSIRTESVESEKKKSTNSSQEVTRNKKKVPNAIEEAYNENSYDGDDIKEQQQLFDMIKMNQKYNQAELENEILEQRQQEIQQIEKDVETLHDMMNDINVMIHEQGNIIDMIDDEIDSTEENMKAGNKDIQIANETSQKNKNKIIIITILTIVIAAGILVFLFEDGYM